MKLVEDIADKLKTVFNRKENVAKQTLINPANGNINLDLSLSSSYKLILTGNSTINFLNAQNGNVNTIIIKQDASGNHSVTLPANLKWSGNVIPTWSTNPSAIDILTIYYDLDEDKYYGVATTDYA
jgi:hypothetical protein